MRDPPTAEKIKEDLEACLENFEGYREECFEDIRRALKQEGYAARSRIEQASQDLIRWHEKLIFTAAVLGRLHEYIPEYAEENDV